MVPIKNPCWFSTKRRGRKGGEGEREREGREKDENEPCPISLREGRGRGEARSESGRKRDGGNGLIPVPLLPLPLPPQVGEREKLKESASRAKRVDSLSSLFYKTRFLLGPWCTLSHRGVSRLSRLAKTRSVSIRRYPR